MRHFSFAIFSVFLHGALLYILVQEHVWVPDRIPFMTAGTANRNDQIRTTQVAVIRPPTQIAEAAEKSPVTPHHPGNASTNNATSLPTHTHPKDQAASPIYRTANELSKAPELIGNAPILFNASNGNASAGTMLLRLLINKSGKVDAIFSEKSTLDRATEGEIILQFYNAVYRPGEINGRPVNSEMYIQVETGI